MTKYKPTSKEMKRVEYLRKEVESLSKILDDIKSCSSVGTKSYRDTGRVSNGSKYSTVEGKALAREEIEVKLENKIVELKRLYTNIINWILNIEDPFIRLIFELKYLHFYTWNQVAIELGGPNNENQVRKTAQRYLEKEKNYD